MTKHALIFDLDGVLAESKQDMPDIVARKLERLAENYYIIVISGCSWEQMKEQCRDKILAGSLDYKFLFLPTSGSQIYTYEGECLFKDELKLKDKVRIYQTFQYYLRDSLLLRNWSGCLQTESYGDIEEDRGSQITFSLRGQEAPLNVKQEFFKKYHRDRERLAQQISESLEGNYPGRFSVRVGGTTSIDVTYADRDKGFGVKEVRGLLNLKLKDFLFFGDMLEPGGNDYPVRQLGVDCVKVENYHDTLEKLNELTRKEDNVLHE